MNECEFVRLIEGYRPVAQNYAIKHFRIGEEEFSDLYQETCLNVWRVANSGKKIRYPKTYLITVMRNLFIDGFRKERNIEFLPYEDSLGERNLTNGHFMSERENPEMEFLTNEFMLEANESIDKLTGVKLNTLRLFEEGYSYSDIAKITDVPKGTVMSRLYHARRKVLADLEQKGVYNAGGKRDYAAEKSQKRKE